MNKLESVSSCSVFIVYLRLVYFFLKYLLEFTNETIWAWGFLCGKPFIFTQIFTISGAFHSFLKICISVDVIFLQLKELSLALLVVQFCWQWILSFLLSENVIISLSFLKNIFTRDRILKWPFFFFQSVPCRCFSTIFWPRDQWWEVNGNLNHCHHACNVSLFSGCYHDFLLIFGF